MEKRNYMVTEQVEIENVCMKQVDWVFMLSLLKTIISLTPPARPPIAASSATEELNEGNQSFIVKNEEIC